MHIYVVLCVWLYSAHIIISEMSLLSLSRRDDCPKTFPGGKTAGWQNESRLHRCCRCRHHDVALAISRNELINDFDKRMCARASRFFASMAFVLMIITHTNTHTHKHTVVMSGRKMAMARRWRADGLRREGGGYQYQ